MTFLEAYLDWINRTAGAWITTNGDASITSMNSYVNRTPTALSYGLNIITPSDQQSFTQIINQGVTAIAPPSATLPAEGGAGSFAVTASVDAVWTATADQSWIVPTVTGAQVDYTVAVNVDTLTRTGSIRVAGTTGLAQVFSITQAGAAAR